MVIPSEDSILSVFVLPMCLCFGMLVLVSSENQPEQFGFLVLMVMLSPGKDSIRRKWARSLLCACANFCACTYAQ